MQCSAVEDWISLVLMFPGRRRLTKGSRYLVTLLSNLTVQEKAAANKGKNATQIHVYVIFR